MGDLVGQNFCAFTSAASSSRFRTVIAAERKTLRTRSDVSIPSGRSHIAGAVSSWQVSRVILSGLRRVVRRDAAVDRSLHRLSAMFAGGRSCDGTLVYPAAGCMFEGSVAASRVAYLQAFCYLGSITLVLLCLASLRKVVMEGINCCRDARDLPYET